MLNSPAQSRYAGGFTKKTFRISTNCPVNNEEEKKSNNALVYILVPAYLCLRSLIDMRDVINPISETNFQCPKNRRNPISPIKNLYIPVSFEINGIKIQFSKSSPTSFRKEP